MICVCLLTTRERVIGLYNFGRVCMSVYQTTAFKSLDVGGSFSVIRYTSPGIRFKFVYEGHPVKVKVKVTRSQTGRKFLFPQRETSIGNNSGSIEHRAVKFACSMGFSATMDQMVCPPSWLRDR